MYHLYSIYISTHYAYISRQYVCYFLMQYKCKRLTFIVLGMVHSKKTIIDLLHSFQVLI